MCKKYYILQFCKNYNLIIAMSHSVLSRRYADVRKHILFDARRTRYSVGHSHRYRNIRVSSLRMDFIKYSKLFIHTGSVHFCYNDLYLHGISTRKHIRYNIEFIVVTGMVIVKVGAAHVNVFSTAPFAI